MTYLSITCEAAWETLWSPYDEATYRQVLDQIHPTDRVVEIGAGDFRLARRIAAAASWVWAIEIHQGLIDQALLSKAQAPRGRPVHGNLHPVAGDARSAPFPQGVTVGVLLMRHCRCFRRYAEKLKAAGAERLITNARWKMGIEVISLQGSRICFQDAEVGWYACWCGAVGFKSGPAAEITQETLSSVQEVVYCPECVHSYPIPYQTRTFNPGLLDGAGILHPSGAVEKF